MGVVDGLPEDRDVALGADHRHGEVGAGGAGPLERVLDERAAVPLALVDAVPDLGPGQLHHDVGPAGQPSGDEVQERPQVEVRVRFDRVRCRGRLRERHACESTDVSEIVITTRRTSGCATFCRSRARVARFTPSGSVDDDRARPRGRTANRRIHRRGVHAAHQGPRGRRPSARRLPVRAGGGGVRRLPRPPNTLTVGVTAVLLVLTLALWAIRASQPGRPPRGALRSARGDRGRRPLRCSTCPVASHRSRSSARRVTGTGGCCSIRRGMDPFVVDSSMVDPRAFMDTLQRYRPE